MYSGLTAAGTGNRLKAYIKINLKRINAHITISHMQLVNIELRIRTGNNEVGT